MTFFTVGLDSRTYSIVAFSDIWRLIRKKITKETTVKIVLPRQADTVDRRWLRTFIGDLVARVNKIQIALIEDVPASLSDAEPLRLGSNVEVRSFSSETLVSVLDDSCSEGAFFCFTNPLITWVSAKLSGQYFLNSEIIYDPGDVRHEGLADKFDHLFASSQVS